ACPSPSRLAPLRLRGRLGSCRNLHVEDRAAAAVGLDPDPPVHAANEFARDVEPQAGAADSAGHVGVEPVELLEDPALLGGWNAEPFVGDGEAHVLACRFYADLHVAASGGVLDGVVDQVCEHLPELAFVGGDSWNVLAGI